MSAQASAGQARPGVVIGGRYLLKELIGEGAMGAIFRAEHLSLQRTVAVKFLKLGSSQDRSAGDRFLREARVVAAVRHRYVVDVLDFGATPAGESYMVMELLSGRTLFARMLDLPPLGLPDVVRIMARLLAGLGAVHAAGIVHGDLKPENVLLLTEDGREDYPKLLDFGVSRVGGREATGRIRSVLPTEERAIVGTPEYMSPEQARGHKLDPRSDIFTAGTMLYELLTGVMPYQGQSVMETLRQIDAARPPIRVASLRPDLSASIVAVVERAMSPEPERRFQSAADMRLALLEAAADHAARGTAGSAQASADGSVPPIGGAQELFSAVGDAFEPGDSGVIAMPEEIRARARRRDQEAATLAQPSVALGSAAAPVALAGSDAGSAVSRFASAGRARRVMIAAVAAALVACIVGIAWALAGPDPDVTATELPTAATPTMPAAAPAGSIAVEPAASVRSGPEASGAELAVVPDVPAVEPTRVEPTPSTPADPAETERPGPSRRPGRRAEGLVRDPGF